MYLNTLRLTGSGVITGYLYGKFHKYLKFYHLSNRNMVKVTSGKQPLLRGQISEVF